MSFCNWDSRKRREPVRNNWEWRRSIKHTGSGKCRILPLLNFLISQVVVLNVEGKWLQRRDVLLHSACYYSTLNYLSFWPSPTSLHTCCCQDSWFWGADYYYLIIYSLRGKAFKGIHEHQIRELTTKSTCAWDPNSYRDYMPTCFLFLSSFTFCLSANASTGCNSSSFSCSSILSSSEDATSLPVMILSRCLFDNNSSCSEHNFFISLKLCFYCIKVKKEIQNEW